MQGLTYTFDNVTAEADEYPQYPIETLFNQKGDCEDMSILTAALLKEMGYNVVLIYLPSGHMGSGISLPDINGWSYKYNGTSYYYIETTETGYYPGMMPLKYQWQSAYIYPV